MSRIELTRRGALAGLGAFAAASLGGAAQLQAATGHRIRAIAVNTVPLLARSGNPTANWVRQVLPGQLAHAFAAHMAPGDPAGATLSVRIDSIVLGSIGPGGRAIDTMTGSATLTAGAGAGRHASLRATTSPVDHALAAHALHGRVTALSQTFAHSLARKMGYSRVARQSLRWARGGLGAVI